MKKRIITLFMAFSMFLCNQFEVFSAYFEESKTLLTELGIISELNEYEGVLTRAEFVEMIVDFIPPKMYNENINGFQDVTDSFENYSEIIRAKAYGYISGHDGMFYPNEKITPVDAVVILVNMMGMKSYADAIGGYPNGYYQAASDLGVFKGTSSDKGITFENAVIMLANLLEASEFDITSIAGDKVTISTENAETVMNKYFDVYKIEGRVQTVGKAAITYDAQTSENTVTVAGKVYAADKDFSRYLGKNVTAYYKEETNNSIGTVILMTESKKQETLTLSSRDIETVADGKVSYTLDNKTKDIKISQYVDVVYNGRFAPNYNIKDLENLYSASVEFISYNNNFVYDLLVITEYRSAVIKSIDLQSETVYFENKTLYGQEQKKIKLEDYSIFDSVGIAMNLSDLKRGYLLAIIADENNETVKLIANNDRVRGTARIHEDNMYVNDVCYPLNKDFNLAENKISPTTPYIYYIDIQGFIVAADDSYTEYEYYGFLTKLYQDESDETKVSIQVFDENGEFTDYELKERVMVNTDKLDAEDTLTNHDLMNIDGVNKQMIKYTVQNGVVKSIQTAQDLSTSQDYAGYTEDKFTKDYVTTSGFFRYTSKVLNNRYLLNDETRIFIVPANKNDKESYDIGTVSMYSYDSSALGSVEVYDSDIFKRASVVVLTPQVREYSLDAMVVSDVQCRIDENDEVKYFIKGFVAGQEKEYIYDTDQNPGILPGDVIRISVKDTELMQYQMMYSVQNKNYDKEPSDMITTNKEGGSWVTVCGKVKNSADNIMTLTINDRLSPLVYPMHASGVVYNYFSDKGRVEVGDFEDIAEGARVFIHRYYDSARVVVVYR